MDTLSPTVDRVLDDLATNEDYQIVRRRLADLMEDDEAYDDDLRKPTISAFTTAYAMMERAALRLGAGFPRALVAPDGVGGIRVEWRRSGRSVMLLIRAPKDGRHIVYHSLGDTSSIEAATDAILAHRLREL